MNTLFKKSGPLAHHLRLKQTMTHKKNMHVVDEHQHVSKVLEMAKDLGCHQVTRRDIEHYRHRIEGGHEWKIKGLVESYAAYCDFVISLTEEGYKTLVYEFPALMDATFNRRDVNYLIKDVTQSYTAIHPVVPN